MWRESSTRAVRRVTAALAGTLLLVGAVAVLAQSPKSADPLSSAAAVVESLHAVLVENLRDGDALGFNGRVARLAPVVAAGFDFPAITRVALGDAFERLSAAQRAKFERLLEDLSVATYADQFSGSGTQTRFVLVSRQPARGASVLVRTHLERPREVPVALDYVLHDTANGPRIVNVLADGVSDLSLKRAQYAAVIASNGVDNLLERVEQQLRQLARGAGSGS